MPLREHQRSDHDWFHFQNVFARRKFSGFSMLFLRNTNTIQWFLLYYQVIGCLVFRAVISVAVFSPLDSLMLFRNLLMSIM